MLFNSFDFIIFFPCVCLIYFLIPQRLKYLFLLAASYYFYMCWNPQYALLMLTSTVITYLSGLLIGKSRTQGAKKLWVASSFILNLGILFFFKYFDFALENLNALLGALHMQPVSSSFDIILPVGISFYTFQALSYTMDVFRKEIYPEKNFFKYALFVSFFPQLVAGPIERSKNLLKQISVSHYFSFERMRAGLIQMLFGFFQKVVLADRIALLVDEVYNNYALYQGVEIALATACFAIQIYCDFGSYSNIAIGAAKIMGFDLMENFNTPYFADSVTDFWRRWHISLSTWFRDYLYIPLGGNRKGTFRKYINIMIVFLTSGLWHGASWTYVIWGGLNGLFQVIGNLTKPLRDKVVSICKIDRKVFSHRLFKILVTFILVDFTWLFFRAATINDALIMLKRMVKGWNPWVLFDGSLLQMGLDGADMLILVISLVILFIVDFCKYQKVPLTGWLCRQGMWFRWMIYLGMLFFILIFGIYGPAYDASQFIYFQF